MNWTCSRCHTAWDSRLDEYHSPDCQNRGPNVAQERLRELIREEVRRELEAFPPSESA